MRYLFWRLNGRCCLHISANVSTDSSPDVRAIACSYYSANRVANPCTNACSYDSANASTDCGTNGSTNCGQCTQR